MQMSLTLSKHKELDLYAYFIGVEHGRSSLIKNILSDYIRQEQTVHLQMLQQTCEYFLSKDLPSVIEIHLYFGKKDTALTTYFQDCPAKLRSKCAKSILHMMVAPYTQSVYHTNLKLPYGNVSKSEQTASAGMELLVNLFSRAIAAPLQPQMQMPMMPGNVPSQSSSLTSAVPVQQQISVQETIPATQEVAVPVASLQPAVSFSRRDVEDEQPWQKPVDEPVIKQQPPSPAQEQYPPTVTEAFSSDADDTDINDPLLDMLTADFG